MKILCETTGPFQIVDFDNGGAVVRSHRPSVAVNSHLISSRAAIGQIIVLGNVTDEATDDEFANYWKETEGDKKLAVASFLEAYAIPNEPAEDGPKLTAVEQLAAVDGDHKRLDVPTLKQLAGELEIDLGEATKKADIIKVITDAAGE